MSVALHEQLPERGEGGMEGGRKVNTNECTCVFISLDTNTRPSSPSEDLLLIFSTMEYGI